MPLVLLAIGTLRSWPILENAPNAWATFGAFQRLPATTPVPLRPWDGLEKDAAKPLPSLQQMALRPRGMTSYLVQPS